MTAPMHAHAHATQLQLHTGLQASSTVDPAAAAAPWGAGGGPCTVVLRMQGVPYRCAVGAGPAPPPPPGDVPPAAQLLPQLLSYCHTARGTYMRLGLLATNHMLSKYSTNPGARGRHMRCVCPGRQDACMPQQQPASLQPPACAAVIQQRQGHCTSPPHTQRGHACFPPPHLPPLLPGGWSHTGSEARQATPLHPVTPAYLGPVCTGLLYGSAAVLRKALRAHETTDMQQQQQHQHQQLLRQVVGPGGAPNTWQQG